VGIGLDARGGATDPGRVTSWTLRDVPAPASLDDPADPAVALFLGAAAVRTAVVVDTWGDDDLADPPRTQLAWLRDQVYEPERWRAAVDDDGRVLGVAAIGLPLADNTHLAFVHLDVHPDARGRGVGSALHDDALEVARAAGRTRAMAATHQRREPDPGPTTLDPPTGEGRVDGAEPSVRFALDRGWALEQVTRRSMLHLPGDEAARDALAADAAAVAGPDYRLHTWGTVTPAEWADEYARLVGRMSTDAPMAGLDYGAEEWDAERVAHRQAQLADGGMELLQTVVEHVPTGTLAAFTNFWMPPDHDDYVHQGDTLVVPEHRGRRLGMLVKCANLAALRAERPSVRRISTWNAQENRWMLAINVTLGFRPAGGSGEFQRDL
jgi:GNAT superfamily N-acetyltransferase